jgi:hypothetical protein
MAPSPSGIQKLFASQKPFPTDFIEIRKNRKKWSIFGTKFNFQKLEKENRKASGFPGLSICFWLIFI